MLVLTRKADEQILIGDDIKITLVRVRGNSVRIGIDAPRQVRIVRGELDPLDQKSSCQTELETDDVQQVFAHPQIELADSPNATRAHKNRVGHLMDDIGETPRSSTEHSVFIGRIHRPDGESGSAGGPLTRFLAR